MTHPFLKSLSAWLPAFLSLIAHGALAARLAGGHAAPGRDTASPETLSPMVEIDVQTEVETVNQVLKQERQAVAPQSHTHAYPIAASHDHRPHDPSVVHRSLPLISPLDVRANANDPSPAVDAPSASESVPLRFTLAAHSANQGQASTPSAQGAGEAAALETFSESGVSVPARLRAAAPVSYPSGARSEGLELDVPVLLLLDASGQVLEASVVKHAGYGFDEAALAAVKHYAFVPAQKDGKAVRVRMRWNVQFRLN
jgi:TonB family protein